MRGRLTLIIASALALAQIPSPGRTEPLIQTVETHDNTVGEIEKRVADFVHRPSGFVFPLKLGAMPARKTVTYGSADAGVYYTLLGGGNGDPWLDLIVYRTEVDLEAETRAVRKALIDQFQAEQTAPPAGLPPAPARAAEGWYIGKIGDARYLTGFRIVLIDGWYVKARLTIPLSGQSDPLQRGLDGLGAIPWKQGPLRPLQAPVSGAASSAQPAALERAA